MQPKVIQRILGLLLMVFSFTMLPPVLIGILYKESSSITFLYSFVALLVVGALIWLPVQRHKSELRTRDGFIVVVLFWLVLGMAGAVPLFFGTNPHMSITDAVFESMSGLTTTGATVITGIDDLPKCLLFYRQQLQWLGGMGIIVLAVAILPMLGVGGMQLYRAETPGPIKDNKLTPRITETAKALWYIYLGLTIACALSFYLAGMSWFDAVSHSFSTVAIGGFSTHDASIGYFDSGLIETITVVFMLLAGINFSLHFGVLRHKSLKIYYQDAEFKNYLFNIFIATTLITLYLLYSGTFNDGLETFRAALFQTVSIATTTGFATTDFAVWPAFLPVMLIFLSFIGGCAGSAGGGLKVIRYVLLLRQGMREITRLIHPNAEVVVKLGGKTIQERVISAVWGFFSLYVATFAIIMLLVMATGLDQVTAFSAVAACLNNLGPGLGDVSSHYGEINSSTKWILIFAMLAGRLEIFSILVLLTPEFWRK